MAGVKSWEIALNVLSLHGQIGLQGNTQHCEMVTVIKCHLKIQRPFYLSGRLDKKKTSPFLLNLKIDQPKFIHLYLWLNKTRDLTSPRKSFNSAFFSKNVDIVRTTDNKALY